MILSASNITKSFGAETIIEDISFRLNFGDKLGIVGVNGAGKSTLFKIITNELQADSGEVVIASGVKIGVVAQLGGLDDNNTVYEELLSVFSHIIKLEEKLSELTSKMGQLTCESLNTAMDSYERLNFQFEQNNGYEYKSRIRGIIAGLGFIGDEEKKIAILSGGQKTRIALGKLLLSAPDLLLLDEPTNHLDISSIKWLEDFLRNYSKTVITISHDRYFLERTVVQILEIENKHAALYNGSYSYYARQKDMLRQQALKRFLDQQKVIKKQEESIRLLRSFNREKSIKRAVSKQKQLDKLEKLDKPENLPDKIRIDLTPRIESGNDVLNVNGLSKSFGANKLFQNISFEIKKGDKAAIIGPNGIGKTTLFKIILGELQADSGSVTSGHKVKVGYYDQGQQKLNDSLTILQEISDAYPKLTTGEIRNVLAAFVFTGDDVFKTIGTLSGGEKGRVSLAKVMLAGSNLLLFDEPTNHLDIYSKEILEDALMGFMGTLLFISHDRYFINSIANKIIEMDENGITVYNGGYEYYLYKKEELEKELAEIAAYADDTSKDQKNDWLIKKESEASIRKQRNRIKKLKSQISETEEQIEELTAELNSSAISSDYEKAHDLYEKKEAAEQLLLSLYEEFESLENV